jgi:hypothetical protein
VPENNSELALRQTAQTKSSVSARYLRQVKLAISQFDGDAREWHIAAFVDNAGQLGGGRLCLKGDGKQKLQDRGRDSITGDEVVASGHKACRSRI